jgi:hypothetical protein
VAQIAVNAADVHFDASDLMRPTMQTAFYQAVLAYVSDPGRFSDQHQLDGLLADLERVRSLAY